MTIEFTPLHNELHAYRDGSVLIDIPFDGNLLALEVTTKPEYLLSRQIIGTLYQVYGSIGKGYSIYSGKDIIKLELPQTEKLWFSPTSFLSDSYTLNLSYALAGVYGSESGATPLPEQILGLPVRVSDVEDTLGAIADTLGTLEESEAFQNGRLSALEGAISSPSWDSITDKPLTFDPSEHNHAISDITGLVDTLTDLETPSWEDITGKPTSFTPATHGHSIDDVTDLTSTLGGIATDLLGFEERISDLETSPSGGVSISVTSESTLAKNGSFTFTAKEILGVYKKSFVIGTNLIPIMTSNTAPSPLVASSNGGASGSPFNAFDKVLTDRGFLAGAQAGRYVQIDMGTSITANTLSCLVRTASIAALEYARKLTLVTSNDDVTWSSPLVAETDWQPTGDTFANFFFATTTARYWRLFMEDRPSGYPAVNEIKLSLSTVFSWVDVSKEFTISRNNLDASVGSTFTLTKLSNYIDTVVATYL